MTQLHSFEHYQVFSCSLLKPEYLTGKTVSGVWQTEPPKVGFTGDGCWLFRSGKSGLIISYILFTVQMIQPSQMIRYNVFSNHLFIVLSTHLWYAL
jgi:hypothetical protein